MRDDGVVFIGDAGVGKSSLVEQVIFEKFDPAIPETTMFDMYKNTNKKNESAINYYDSSGLDKWRSVTQGIYGKARVWVLCFALNNRASFQRLDFWMSQVAESRKNNAPIILVGTKLDLKGEHAIQAAEIDAFCQQHGSKIIGYFETSAKDDINVDKMVDEISARYGVKNSPKRNFTASEMADLMVKPLSDILNSISQAPVKNAVIALIAAMKKDIRAQLEKGKPQEFINKRLNCFPGKLSEMLTATVIDTEKTPDEKRQAYNQARHRYYTTPALRRFKKTIKAIFSLVGVAIGAVVGAASGAAVGAVIGSPAAGPAAAGVAAVGAYKGASLGAKIGYGVGGAAGLSLFGLFYRRRKRYLPDAIQQSTNQLLHCVKSEIAPKTEKTPFIIN